jgi:hypothetical protein
MLLCQQFLPLLPSLKETPTLAYDGVRGIMPFPERIVINWIHRLFRVELAVTPSFVVSPSVAELKPCDKNDECRDKQCRQNARTDQQLLHLESFLSDLRPFRDQKESSSFFAPHFIAGGFIPAFARCCFCIAASLLVFTSPMTSPLALLYQSCYVNGIADPVVPHCNTWQLSCRWAPTASIDYQRRPFKSLYRNIVYAPHDSFLYFM